MAIIKKTSTILFAVLLIGLGHFASSYPDYGYGHGPSPIFAFIQRLRSHLMSNPTDLSFEMRSFVLQELDGTSEEFQNLCIAYESQYDPAAALNKAIYYVFYYYKEHGDDDVLEEIEEGDPVGFNVYLRERNVDKEDSDFMSRANTFVSVMRSRIRLQKLKYELTNIPQEVRYPIATEYSGLPSEPINYFIKIAAKQFGRKMYPIDTVVLDEFATYKNKKIDDVQLFGATYYDFGGPSQVNLHALCINYKAKTKMVHVYDSGNSGYLEGRQKAIIQKLYPDRDIEFEKSTALQGGNTTCAIFAITYATYLLNGKDPAKDRIKLNDVHGDETLYMRLHIMDMLSKGKVSMPN